MRGIKAGFFLQALSTYTESYGTPPPPFFAADDGTFSPLRRYRDLFFLFAFSPLVWVGLFSIGLSRCSSSLIETFLQGRFLLEEDFLAFPFSFSCLKRCRLPFLRLGLDWSVLFFLIVDLVLYEPCLSLPQCRSRRLCLIFLSLFSRYAPSATSFIDRRSACSLPTCLPPPSFSSHRERLFFESDLFPF